MMRYLQPSRLLTLLLLIPAAHPLQLEPRQRIIAAPSSPVAPTQQQQQAAAPGLDTAVDAAKRWTAGAALAAALAVGTWTLPASAVDISAKTIQVEADAPVLLKRLRGEKYQTELLDALRELQDVVGPDAIKVTPPSNVRGAIRDLLSGRGEVTLNGQPVDVTLLSSERGEVTVRISNPLLPKIPVLSSGTNVPFLSSRGDDSAVTTAATTDFAKPDLREVLEALWSIFGPDEDVTAASFLNVLGRAYGWDMTTPFQDQKFLGGAVGVPVPRAADRGGSFTYQPSNKDVAGGTALTLGAVYAGAYAYHNSMNEYEANLAAEKKKERAVKAKSAKEKKDAEAAEAAKREAKEEAVSSKKAASEEMKKAADDAAAKAKTAQEAVAKAATAASKVIDEPPQLVRVDDYGKAEDAGQEKTKRSRLLRIFRRSD